MSEEIRVHVIDYGRKSIYMRYRDPVIGKQLTKSTGTKRRREAEKIAAKWEADLQEGRYKPPSKILWSEFRERYESHLETSVSDSTVDLFGYIASVFERIVDPERLAAVKKPQLRKFVDTLRNEGKTTGTLRSYLGAIRTGLRWAKSEGMLVSVPTVELPEQKKNGKLIKADVSGGRPLAGEEFERLLAAVPKVLFPKRKNGRQKPVDPAVVESWRHVLQGLFWSGLRIGESHLLTWDDDTLPSIDLTGRRPMMWIPGEFQKNGKDAHCPIVPEFFEFLSATPDDQRTGFVFNPLCPKIDTRPTLATFKRKIADFGRRANVKVKDLESGRVKFASAHDLRRSFGFRWSQRVMPTVLKDLMRHSRITTTEKYYATQDARQTAEVVWAAIPSQTAVSGNAGGNFKVTPTCSDSRSASTGIVASR